MLDSLALLRAMNGIHEEDVVMAGNMYFNERKTTHMKTKRIVTLALAAALILVLGVGAWAAYDKVAGPDAAERVALEQIEVWKELGILSPQVHLEGPAKYIKEEPARQGSDYWYGRLFPHCYDVRFYGDGKYGGVLHVDTLTGELLFASISAHPDETEAPVAVSAEVPVDPEDPNKGFREETVYCYENFEDILPADLTVDDFCSKLAAYWGFSGYRIADTVDDYVPEYEKHWEAVDGSTPLKDLPKVNPTNYYLTVFFDGDQTGAPMYIELGNYPTYINITLGMNHAIG